jgi:predicted enzyme related to lactoylglutathione lyase
MHVLLGSIVFDCADMHRTATFYSELTGWPIVRTEDDWIDLQTEKGVLVSFQLAPDHVPPQWPDPGQPQQAHLDLDVDDMDAAHAKAVSLGAVLLDDSDTHPSFRVYADPAGHPFCLCAN